MITEEDRLLKEMFSCYRPELKAKEDFMNTLEARIKAVEYVNKIQQTQKRKSRQAIFASLAIGLIMGSVITAYLITHPTVMPILGLGLHQQMVSVFCNDLRLISKVLLSALGIAITAATLHSFLEISRDFAINGRKRK